MLKRMNTAKPSDSAPLAALLFGALLVGVLQRFVPFGPLLLYPFTLFGTWVHEVGHGVTAIFVGGKFDHLDIFLDASGIAYSLVQPGWRSGIGAPSIFTSPSTSWASMLMSKTESAEKLSEVVIG